MASASPRPSPGTVPRSLTRMSIYIYSTRCNTAVLIIYCSVSCNRAKRTKQERIKFIFLIKIVELDDYDSRRRTDFHANQMTNPRVD